MLSGSSDLAEIGVTRSRWSPRRAHLLTLAGAEQVPTQALMEEMGVTAVVVRHGGELVDVSFAPTRSEAP